MPRNKKRTIRSTTSSVTGKDSCPAPGCPWICPVILGEKSPEAKRLLLEEHFMKELIELKQKPSASSHNNVQKCLGTAHKSSLDEVQCRFCSKIFRNKKALGSHVGKIHNETNTSNDPSSLKISLVGDSLSSVIKDFVPRPPTGEENYVFEQGLLSSQPSSSFYHDGPLYYADNNEDGETDLNFENCEEDADNEIHDFKKSNTNAVDFSRDATNNTELSRFSRLYELPIRKKRRFTNAAASGRTIVTSPVANSGGLMDVVQNHLPTITKKELGACVHLLKSGDDSLDGNESDDSSFCLTIPRKAVI